MPTASTEIEFKNDANNTIEVGKLVNFEQREYIVDEKLVELQKLNVYIWYFSYDKNKVYIMVGESMTREAFDKLLEYLQNITESSVDDVKTFFCKFLNQTEEELYDLVLSLYNNFSVGISYKEKDFKLYLQQKGLDEVVLKRVLEARK